MSTLPRLYPILNSDILSTAGVSPELATEAMLEAGARILQFRHKGPFDRDTLDLAGRIAELCRQAQALFVLNDRPDIALILGIPSIHLGQTDLSPAQARQVHHGLTLVGLSTHNESQFLAAREDPAVDYLAFGPVFPTSTKMNPDPVVGLAELRRLSVLKGARPLVAIGGISLTRAREVYDAGADSIAVISALAPPESTPRKIRERTAEWLALASVV